MLSYLIIPLIALLTGTIGSLFTSRGVSSWYLTIRKPGWTPPGSVIGAVWTILYILTAASALIVWKTAPRDARFRWIIGLFIFNAILNVLWSFIFFSQQMIGTAVVEAALLDASVLALIILIRPVSKTASLLLVPYAVWVTFATYLTYTVWTLNM